MDTFASEMPAVPHEGPQDQPIRLYREIGISAVAAALEISDASLFDFLSDDETRGVRRAA